MSLPHSNLVRIRYYTLPLSENNVSIRTGVRVELEAELLLVLVEGGTDYLDMDKLVAVVGKIFLDMPHSSETETMAYPSNPILKSKVGESSDINGT